MLDLQTVAKGLLALSYATRGQKPDDVNGAMAAVWLDALNRNRVTPKEFVDRCRQVSDTAGFFPSVGEFLAPVLKAKPSFAVIQDPVYTGLSPLGVPTVASASSLPNGVTALPATATEDDLREAFGVPKALPAPSENPPKRPLAERIAALKAELGVG